MGFVPMNMDIYAREHEHSCPRTLVLLTDYSGHKRLCGLTILVDHFLSYL